MKTLLTAVSAILLLTGISNQSSAQAYKQGDMDISLSAGFGSWLGAGIPVTLAAEYGATPSVSFGLTSGYSSYGNAYYSLMRNHNLFVAARGSFHAAQLFKSKSETLDPYAGLLLGYNHINTEYVDIYYPYGAGSFNSNRIFLGAFIGTRLMFGKHFGGFAELGYGTTLLQLGVTVKL